MEKLSIVVGNSFLALGVGSSNPQLWNTLVLYFGLGDGKEKIQHDAGSDLPQKPYHSHNAKRRRRHRSR